jgi:hypothetical protein
MTFNEEKKANVSILKANLLRKSSKMCKICMDKRGYSPDEKFPRQRNEICQKCGLDTRFTNKLMVNLKKINLSGYIMVNILHIKVSLEDLDRFETDSDKMDSFVSKIFDFENVAIEQDKLTKTLDQIWN